MSININLTPKFVAKKANVLYNNKSIKKEGEF